MSTRARVLLVAILATVALAALSACSAPVTRAVRVMPASENVPAAAGRALSAQPAPTGRSTVIAWQPSHQADTGVDWDEHVICGDIVDRVIALMPEFEHVKAWETGMGLSGSNGYRPQPKNTAAFDSELRQANSAPASVFISVHNDGGAPSGVLGMCMPGDADSRALTERLKAALVSATGLPDRGMREERLYSLEQARNQAGIRLLLEIGDNKADRAFLLDANNRQAIAQALADSLRESDLP